MLAASTADWIALIGGLMGGTAAIVSAWAALARARNEKDDECEQKMKTYRAEAEQVADELHQLRMKKVVGE